MFEKVHGTSETDDQVLSDEIPDQYQGNSVGQKILLHVWPTATSAILLMTNPHVYPYATKRHRYDECYGIKDSDL